MLLTHGRHHSRIDGADSFPTFVSAAKSMAENVDTSSQHIDEATARGRLCKHLGSSVVLTHSVALAANWGEVE